MLRKEHRSKDSVLEAPGKAVADRELPLAIDDLKTPVSVLNGYLDLLLTEKIGPLNEQQKSVLLKTQESGARIAAFIEDSATLSALKVHRILPQFEVGSIQDCVSELVSFWRFSFDKRDVRLLLRVDEQIPRFRFDFRKTQRVVSNLLEYALHGSDAGDVVSLDVQLYHWERRRRSIPHSEERRINDAEANAVAIRISDETATIPEELRPAVFEEHFRVPRQGKGHGSGLGLAIAKNLVRAIQGDIWLDTGVKNGSHFVVVLPLRH